MHVCEMANDFPFGLAGVQRLLTREGLPACDEAIHFLMSVRSSTLFPVPRSVDRWTEQCERSLVVRVVCFDCTWFQCQPVQEVEFDSGLCLAAKRTPTLLRCCAVGGWA